MSNTPHPPLDPGPLHSQDHQGATPSKSGFGTSDVGSNHPLPPETGRRVDTAHSFGSMPPNDDIGSEAGGRIFPAWLIGVGGILALVALSPLVLYQAPESWMHASWSMATLVAVFSILRISRNIRTPVEQADRFKLGLVLVGAALFASMHLWSPINELSKGFLILTFCVSILVHTLFSLILANIAIALAWAIAWMQSGLAFSGTVLIAHLAVAPSLSYALFASIRSALDFSAFLLQKQKSQLRERQDAIRLVVNESARRAQSEAKMRRMNQEFKDFVDHIPAICFRRTREKILFINSAYEHIFGRKIEELVADPTSFIKSIHPEDQERIIDHYQNHFFSEPCSVEYRILRPDGTVRWIHLTTQLVATDEPSSVEVIGCAQDITARKQAEEQLSQQKALLELILETVPDQIYVKNIDREIILGNPAFKQSAFTRSADPIGKKNDDVISTSIHQISRETDEAVLREGKLVQRSFSGLGEDGIEHHHEVTKLPLRIDGKISGIVGLCRDVTEKRERELELRRQKALLELILETVPDEIFVKDSQRKMLLANRAYCEHMQLKLDQILEKNSDSWMPPSLVNTARQTDETILRGEAIRRMEVCAKNQDGTNVYYEIDKLPLTEDGKVTGILGIARNISERKEVESRLKEQETSLMHASRLSLMGEFVAELAHEVNQPLFSILNYANAVANTLDSGKKNDVSEVRNWVEQILQEATRGGQIVKKLRSFVKRAEIQGKTSCMKQIIRESIALLALEALQAHVEIECELDEDTPAVHVDRVQIQQVLINLLKNALEAHQQHESPSPRIVIRTSRCEDSVTVAVVDNGPGISASGKDKILEPFFTTKKDGVGLGLAISRTIIEAHEGNLAYEKNDWGGMTFHFKLKYDDREDR